MSVCVCKNCGRETNSATSNYWLDVEPDGKTPKKTCVATVCYVAFVNGKSVKGCSWTGQSVQDAADAFAELDAEFRDKAIELLREAWVTVDYFDHNCKLSVQIQDFLRQLERPIQFRETGVCK